MLPYPWLLASQILLLAWMIRVNAGTTRGTIRRIPRLGRFLQFVGLVYFAGMLLRLVLGATMLSDARWFASPLPTIFHLVLATFVWLYGAYHAQRHPGGRPA